MPCNSRGQCVLQAGIEPVVSEFTAQTKDCNIVHWTVLLGSLQMAHYCCLSHWGKPDSPRGVETFEETLLELLCVQQYDGSQEKNKVMSTIFSFLCWGDKRDIIRSSNPPPHPFFFPLLCQTCCGIGPERDIQQFSFPSEGHYRSPISFQIFDMYRK